MNQNDRIKKTFAAYRNNIYSQNGEDGVLVEVLHRLKLVTGQFVEFGAWDGKYLSNTYALLCTGWTGVYIEADQERYKDLVITKQNFSSQLEIFNCFVGFKGENTLDKILAKSKIAKEFEVLSIDIDSYDWQVWEALTNYRPIVVIIEIESSIPPGILQVHQPPHAVGSSFSSTLKLAENKQYSLICHTGNMIFVRNDFLTQMGLSELEIQFPEIMFDYTWVADDTTDPSR